MTEKINVYPTEEIKRARDNSATFKNNKFKSYSIYHMFGKASKIIKSCETHRQAGRPTSNVIRCIQAVSDDRDMYVSLQDDKDDLHMSDKLKFVRNRQPADIIKRIRKYIKKDNEQN